MKNDFPRKKQKYSKKYIIYRYYKILSIKMDSFNLCTQENF